MSRNPPLARQIGHPLLKDAAIRFAHPRQAQRWPHGTNTTEALLSQQIAQSGVTSATAHGSVAGSAGNACRTGEPGRCGGRGWACPGCRTGGGGCGGAAPAP